MEHLDIFPTRLYKFSICKELIDNVLDNYELTDNTFDDILDKPNFLKLQNEVLHKSISGCPHTYCIGDWKIITSWINHQPAGCEGFKYHSHTDSFMSCVLYLKGTNMHLSFKDSPRESPVNMTDRSSNYEIIVRHTYNSDIDIPVEVGDLILFPSYVLHKPNKNESEEMRVSIAYNLMPCRVKKESTTVPWIMDLEL